MKKALSFLIASLFFLFASSQNTEHLKFMGIPMGISINQFQKQLTQKGLTYQNTLDDGTRIFEGVFAGHSDASIFISSDLTTNIVYRGKAVLTCYDITTAKLVYEDISTLLEKKYSDQGLVSPVVNDEESGLPMRIVFLENGRIDIFMHKMNNITTSYMDCYLIYIDYHDSLEESKHDDLRMEDL